jgi:hypothetical protein
MQKSKELAAVIRRTTDLCLKYDRTLSECPTEQPDVSKLDGMLELQIGLDMCAEIDMVLPLLVVRKAVLWKLDVRTVGTPRV